MGLFGGDDGGQERTEDPTERRRQEAAKEGQVPRSAELSGAVTLLTGSLVLAYAGGRAMTDQLEALLREGSRWLVADPLSQGAAAELIGTVAQRFFLAFLPFGGALALVALGVGLAQGRGVVTLQPLAPKWSRVNPAAGLGRVFGGQALVTLVKSLLKFLVLGAVGYVTVRGAWEEVLALSSVGVVELGPFLRDHLLDLTLTVGGAFLVLSLADYAWEVYRHERTLKMTKQQVQQESKDSDGNPLVKSRMRSLAMNMRRKRMLGDVKKADVVITNPTHIAVALKYEFGRDGAPMVLAMGERKLAQRIKQIAREAGIPTVENKPLARALLATAKVGKPIPVDLYTAVAEVLAFVFRQRGVRLA